MFSTCFELHVFTSGRSFVHAVLYGMFSCIYVSSLAGGRMWSILLLVSLHNCITMHGIKNKIIHRADAERINTKYRLLQSVICRECGRNCYF